MKNEENLKRVRFLENKRLFITPTSIDDFDDHYRWDHDREIIYLDDEYFRAKPYGKAKEAFEKKINSDKIMAFTIIIKETGENAGLVELYDINNYERKCFWGIILDKKFWKQGYGTGAAHLIIEYVFEDLGFRRLKSYTHSGNPVSMHFQEKLGFIKEAVFRKEYFFNSRYVDRIDYAMLREEYENKYRNK